MAGAHRALVDLRAQGAIKAFGVGVNDWSILLRFAADGDFDCFMLAGRYTLLDHTALDTFMPDCERRGISVLMAAPFNSGILATGARPGATYFYTGADAEIVGAHAAASRRSARGTASRSPPPRCSFRSRIRSSPASSRACAPTDEARCEHRALPRANPGRLLGRAQARGG